jgi:hypothetical protein
LLNVEYDGGQLPSNGAELKRSARTGAGIDVVAKEWIGRLHIGESFGQVCGKRERQQGRTVYGRCNQSCTGRIQTAGVDNVVAVCVEKIDRGLVCKPAADD